MTTWASIAGILVAAVLAGTACRPDRFPDGDGGDGGPHGAGASGDGSHMGAGGRHGGQGGRHGGAGGFLTGGAPASTGAVGPDAGDPDASSDEVDGSVGTGGTGSGGASGTGGLATGGSVGGGGIPGSGGETHCLTNRDCSPQERCIGTGVVPGCGVPDCDDDSDCVDGYCIDHVCLRHRTLGEPCAPAVGGASCSSRYCNSQGYCAARTYDPGAPCVEDGQCGDEFVACVANRCQSLPGQVHDCYQRCLADYFCVPESFPFSTWSCDPRRLIGQPCGDRPPNFDLDTCELGAYCLVAEGAGEGVCRPYTGVAGLGEACNAGKCDYPYRCTTLQQNGVCRPPDACASSSDCLPSEVCRKTSACTTTPCETDSDCGSGLYCASKTCRPPRAFGESCGNGERCVEGASCDATTGKCVTRNRKLNEACTSVVLCEAPLVCLQDLNSVSATCHADVVYCDYQKTFSCPVSMFCGLGSTGYACFPRLLPGAPCYYDDPNDTFGTACPDGTLCPVQGCDEAGCPPPPTCRPQGTAYTPCDVGGCEPGLWCGADNVCRPPVAVGAPCGDPSGPPLNVSADGCPENTYCELTTHQCTPKDSSVGEPCELLLPATDSRRDLPRFNRCEEGLLCALNVCVRPTPCLPGCGPGETCTESAGHCQ